MPKHVKPLVKEVTETMLDTQDRATCDNVVVNTYDIFTSKPISEIASVVGVSKYRSYATDCSGLYNLVKGMPIHVKAAYYFNHMIEKLGLANKYELVNDGDKIRFFYCLPTDKNLDYHVPVIGYKYSWPDELAELFVPNYDLIFRKMVFQPIERMYEAAGWQAQMPNDMLEFDVTQFEVEKRLQCSNIYT